jgi:hypothetical protein
VLGIASVHTALGLMKSRDNFAVSSTNGYSQNVGTFELILNQYIQFQLLVFSLKYTFSFSG